jgi:hypothetical protein
LVKGILSRKVEIMLARVFVLNSGLRETPFRVVEFGRLPRCVLKLI